MCSLLFTLKEDVWLSSTNLALVGCSTNFPFEVVALIPALTWCMGIVVKIRVYT